MRFVMSRLVDKLKKYDGWMDRGWMNGWIDEWIEGKIYGRMNGCIRIVNWLFGREKDGDQRVNGQTD